MLVILAWVWSWSGMLSYVLGTWGNCCVSYERLQVNTEMSVFLALIVWMMIGNWIIDQNNIIWNQVPVFWTGKRRRTTVVCMKRQTMALASRRIASTFMRRSVHHQRHHFDRHHHQHHNNHHNFNQHHDNHHHHQRHHFHRHHNNHHHHHHHCRSSRRNTRLNAARLTAPNVRQAIKPSAPPGITQRQKNPKRKYWNITKTE